ncbi:unnamed protein product [Clavelina lepadiformis]|uniref:Ig-like domain-containing protein n=1 Tax=Clavelina lepadiformis TaxID=159417 RepID=A0ABP0F7W3_CLALP
MDSTSSESGPHFSVFNERSPHRPLLQFGLPKNVTARVGEDVEFECKVYSDPHPHIEWVKRVKVNGSETDPETNEPYVIVLKQSGIHEHDMKVLKIPNVTFEDAGTYACKASNMFGVTENPAVLTVLSGIVSQPAQAHVDSPKH